MRNKIRGRLMSYEVRPLRAGDLPTVTEIYNSACRARESTQATRPWSVKEMKTFLIRPLPSFVSYTCVDKGAVVGWTALTQHDVMEGYQQTAEMSLYVERACRRKGVGTALAHTLLNRAASLDLHCIFAIVFKDMPDVVAFAEEKCGFSVAGCLPEVFSDNGKHYDVLLLEKLIVP